MAHVTCQNPACAKPFTFDPATANRVPVSEFAQDGAGVLPKVSYFVTCPHCKARQDFSTRERN